MQCGVSGPRWAAFAAHCTRKSQGKAQTRSPVKRSTGHTHTHRQRTTPLTPTPTHTHTNDYTPTPQTNTSHKHLTTLEGGNNRVTVALCAHVTFVRVSYTRTDETRIRPNTREVCNAGCLDHGGLRLQRTLQEKHKGNRLRLSSDPGLKVRHLSKPGQN